jgi:hypothetical protein
MLHPEGQSKNQAIKKFTYKGKIINIRTNLI